MRDRLKYFSWVTTLLLFSFTPLSLPEIFLSSSVASAQEAKRGERNPGGRSAEETTEGDRVLLRGIHQAYNRESVKQFNAGQFQIAAGSLQVETRSQSAPAQLQQKLERYQEALVTHRENGDRIGEANTLNQIGAIYTRLEDYSNALDYHRQALAIYEQIGEHKSEAETLGYIGNTYFKAGQYSQVEELFRQKLESLRNAGNKESEQLILEVMRRYLEKEWGFQAGFGVANSPDISIRLSEGDISWQEQLEITQLNLFISREIADRKAQQHSLHSIGWAYRNLGRYSQALQSYQQSLAIARERNIKDHEVFLLIEIGLIYNDIAQYNKALKLLEQALSMLPSLKESGELVVPVIYLKPFAFNQIGLIYKKLKKYDRALDFFQKSLSEPSFEKQNILNNIGLVYFERGQYYQALKSYQQALNSSISNTGDPSAPGFILNSIGLVHTQLGDYAQALESYRKALAIFKELNDRPGERTTLSNIGSLLEKQNQQELAIVFYKEVVNITETIRQGLRELTLQEQEAYTKTIASTYRSLADLLLQQNRVLEAQQVLDLLKVQELEDYLGDVRGSDQTVQGIETLPPEQQLLNEFTELQNQAIAIGRELAQLSQIPEAQLTPEQQQRRNELFAKQGQIKRLFIEFTKRPDVVALVQQLSQTAKEQNLPLSRLTNISDNLKRLEQNAVLLYPLILEDRIELVLATPDSPPIHRTVQVKREQLNRAIAEFRQALEDPRRDAVTPARQLYEWLIKPLENDLAAAKAETIVYAPDSQLRYIPLAALHDGKGWLVQRFRVNNITADSFTDFNTQPQKQLRVLAGAYTANGRPQSFPIGDRQFNFSGLRFAGQEVENLATMIPETTKLLDDQFSKTGTLPRMDNFSVVHFATHAALVRGLAEESFILFGNGDRVSMREVEYDWRMTNVDLIVLSACETGLGSELGNGEEILGFGYLMQNAGARAAIASLWSVSDGGTQALMNALYTALNNRVSAAEALRQAQIALITKNLSAVGGSRGEEAWIEVVSTRTGLPPEVSNNLSHPYYWAPFILIGNGL
jgi:CHAT domain-containing protein/tetratricopeptide (TPR) repeat protein